MQLRKKLSSALLAILALGIAGAPLVAQRGGRGSTPSRPSGGGSARVSAPARSSPSVRSAPQVRSTPSRSAPSVRSAPSRPAPSVRSAPSRSAPSVRSSSTPSRPSYTPRSAPTRFESAPSAPRYDGGRTSTRSDRPSSAGRTVPYDGGRSSVRPYDNGSARGARDLGGRQGLPYDDVDDSVTGPSDRFDSGAWDRPASSGRLDRPYDVGRPSAPGARTDGSTIDLSGAVPPVRYRVPSLSGSTSASTSGARRGLSSRADAAGSRALGPGSRTRSAPAIDRRTLADLQPRREQNVDARAILDRYGKPAADLAPRSRGVSAAERGLSTRHRGAAERGSGDLRRSAASAAGQGRELDGSRRKAADAAGRKADPAAPDPSRRISAARRNARLADLGASNPNARRQLAAAADFAAEASTAGIAVCWSAASSWCGGGFWDPTCGGWYGAWGGGCGWGWGWNSCWGWSWNWCFSWSWCWSPCGYWWGGYWGWPYASSWYVPYASVVVYDGYDYGGGAEVVRYEEPADVDGGAAPEAQAGEGVIAPEGDARADRASLERIARQYILLGDQAFSERRYPDAVHYYAKAIEFAPHVGTYHLVLADGLFATGDYHFAAVEVRRALELDPTLLEHIEDKHGYYSEPSDFDRQLATLEQYVSDHPIDDDARLVLAANYLFARRPAQAADVLQSPFAALLADSPAGKLIELRAARMRAE